MDFKISLDKRKKGESHLGFPIVVKVVGSNKPKRTGYFSKIEHWIQEFELPTKKHPDCYILTDYLNEIKVRISEVRKKAIRQKITVEAGLSMVFRENRSSFKEAAGLHLPDPTDYNDTRVSALGTFDKRYPNVTVDGISVEMVSSFIKERLAKGNKPRGIKSYIGSLSNLFGLVSDQPNPFKGHKIIVPKKINTIATVEDIKVIRGKVLSFTSAVGGATHYRNYFLLMFYLGGFDPEVLARLRYDTLLAIGWYSSGEKGAVGKCAATLFLLKPGKFLTYMIAISIWCPYTKWTTRIFERTLQTGLNL